MKHIVIELAWISKTVHIYYVKDVVKFRNGKLRRRFPKLHRMEDEAPCPGLHTYASKYHQYEFIILEDGATYGTIAHECYHAVCNIFRHKDIVDEEAHAHLLGYLVETIQSGLEKSKDELKLTRWDKLNRELDDALEAEFGSEKPKQERVYTYDEMRTIAYDAHTRGQLHSPTKDKFNKWIQQFKKK